MKILRIPKISILKTELNVKNVNFVTQSSSFVEKKLSPNFPVLGSMHTAIGDINKDGRTNVVTISDSNELKVYSIESLDGL